MAKIGNTDKNLKVAKTINKNGIKFFDASKKPFNIYGIFFDGKGYKRMDTSLANSISEGVATLHANTSGGRVAFETDSKSISIMTKGNFNLMPHMPLTGSAGFDLYTLEGDELDYYKTFVPSANNRKKYESVVEFDDSKMRKIVIHFPLYSDVNSLYIGVEESATVNEYAPYKDSAPIVYYGSSITQGGCASRPGNNYPAIISQKNLRDFVCLGFSGNAHGEDIMIDYVASLPMSVFVLDYEHNDSHEPEKLAERHYKFYKKVREKNPDLPIVVITAPYSRFFSKKMVASEKSVRDSYEKAYENDRNVYFIDGRKFFDEEFKGCATVDGCHPNDYGFVKMAQSVMELLIKYKL